MKKIFILVLITAVLAAFTGCVTRVGRNDKIFYMDGNMEYAIISIFEDIWERGNDEPISYEYDYGEIGWLHYVQQWLNGVEFNAVTPAADMAVDLYVSMSGEVYYLGFDNDGLIMKTPAGVYFKALFEDNILYDGNYYPLWNLKELIGEIRLTHYYDQMTIYPIALREFIDEAPERLYAFERLDREDKTYGLSIDAQYNEGILENLRELILVPVLHFDEDFAMSLQSFRVKDADGDVTFVFTFHGDFVYIWSPVLMGAFEVVSSGTKEYLNRLIELIYPITMEDLENANTYEAVFAEGRYAYARMMSVYYGNSGIVWGDFTQETIIAPNEGGVSVITVIDYVDDVFTDEYIYPETPEWVAFSPTYGEEIVSVTSVSGLLRVATRVRALNNDDFEYWGISDGYIEAAYYLDKESKLILRAEHYLSLDNGERRLISELVIQYGINVLRVAG